MKRVLAVTPGDPDGIGPEITWKTLRARAWDHRRYALLCVGARKPFEKLGARIIEADPLDLRPPKESRPHVWLLPAPGKAPASKGVGRRLLPGFQSGWSVETATRLVQEGRAEALVTGPISKERLQRGGYPYSGHTDLLADLCGAGDVTMMLANEQLRISLVTVHIALEEVPRKLTREGIRRAVEHTADSLRDWWGIRQPRIGVAALNPHAGEDGLFGRQEIELIAPALRDLGRRARGRYQVEGPLPADTLFAKHIMAKPKNRYDAVVCMYHDQGLIPVKLLDFPHTVNITLGLPIVRTSVDHGTGFDIAGLGKADPSSLQSAIRLAIQITQNRRGQS